MNWLQLEAMLKIIGPLIALGIVILFALIIHISDKITNKRKKF